MKIGKKQIFKLRVVTQEGMRIGSVSDIIFDTSTQAVAQYVVHPHWTLERTPLHLFGCSPLLISRDQVISCTDTELIVSNAVKVVFEQRKKQFLNHPLPNQANNPLTRE